MPSLDQLVATSPLPLAQVLLRAVNAKSAVEQHHCAYYLVEATIKLTAAVRVGLWLGSDPPVDHALRQQLATLRAPSTGHWRQLVREAGKALGEAGLGDHALLGGDLGRLPDACRSFLDEAVAADALPAALRKSAVRAGASGFLDAVVSYRNVVMGHGAQRGDDYYGRMGPLLLDAAAELLHSLQLSAVQLAVPTQVMMGGQLETRWLNLTGLAGLPMAAPAGGETVDHGHLVAVGGGAVVPLHPLLVWHRGPDDPMGRVGFLNRAVHRQRKGTSSVSRVEYLDYTTGQLLADVDGRAAVSNFLASVGGAGAEAASEEGDDADDGAEPTDDEGPADAPGELGAVGDFDLLGELGRGGMGVVYRARQVGTGRVVALKVLPPELASDGVARDRFHREIQALSRCDHPNVVRILFHGRDGQRPYYAMEYVSGRDLATAQGVLSAWREAGHSLSNGALSAAVSDSGRPDPRPAALLADGAGFYLQLAELFAGAARGLQHLHDQGIVHRDIKPSNLMLTADGTRLVVTDLGLAQLDDASRALTKTNIKVLGTLRYISPEQLQRNLLEVDGRADVYGLGVTLTELATGVPFFDGDTEQRLIHQILNEDAAPARDRDPELPEDLSLVLGKATEKRANDRYASADELARDLSAVAEGQPISVRPPSLRRRMWMTVERHAVGFTLGFTGLSTMAFVVSVVVLIGLFYQGTNNRERTYGRLTEDRGGFAGAGWIPTENRLPAEFAWGWRAMGVFDLFTGSVVVTRRDGRDVRIERLGADGERLWADSFPRAPIIEQVWHGDEVGKIELHHDGGMYATINRACSDGRRCTLTTSDAYGRPMLHPKWRAFVVRETRDEQGRWTEVTFWDADQPMPGREGAYGLRRSFDEDGVEELQWLGPDQRPMTSKSGWDLKRWSSGERSYHLADGSPVVDRGGQHRDTRENGELPELPELSAEVADRLADARRVYVWSYTDEQGDTAPYRGCAQKARVGDVAWICLDVDGQARPGDDGVTIWLDHVDDDERVVRHERLDARGQPVLGEDGWASYTQEHHRGRVVQRTYLGVDGEPVQVDGGFASWRRVYTPAGQLVEEHFSGVHGEPVVHTELGYASRTDWDGKSPVAPLMPERVHVAIAVDARAWEVARRQVGRNDGPWVERRTAWPSDTERVRTWLDARGRPALDERGVHEERATLDLYDNVVSSRRFGLGGEPVLGDEGCHEERRAFDRWQRLTTWSCYGPDGESVASSDGVARREHTYDAFGTETSVRELGLDGQPVVEASAEEAP